jgi:hypothetical protein
MSTLPAAFAPDYASARARFRAAAAAQNAVQTEHVHPSAQGPAGESLAIDVALLGASDAPALLVVTSGTHGVEGFCGSGIQVALLEDPAVLGVLASAGTAVALVHAVNPYGFAHIRRTNEDNVDLNRNFMDFAAPLPANAAYAEVHGFIVPTAWPPSAETEQRLGAYLAQHGPARLQAAVTGGQYDFADGMLYGGRAPAWSNTTLRSIFRALGSGRQHIGWIDIHTGLGPAGHGEKIFSGPDDAAMIARTRAWFGADVTSFYTGSSSSAQVTGSVSAAAVEECPAARYAGIGLEFGTVPLVHAMQALRADLWLRNQRTRPPQHAAIKQALRDAFFIDTDEWKGMVYGQARVAVLQALRGLAAERS